MLFKGVYIEYRILDSYCACVYHLIVFCFDLLCYVYVVFFNCIHYWPFISYVCNFRCIFYCFLGVSSIKYMFSVSYIALVVFNISFLCVSCNEF
jgi:hypothetical protein